MDSPIRITRENEFYKGYIRFKISVSNESSYVFNDITLDFIYDEKLLHITDHEDFPVKNEKFMLGNIYGNQSRTFTLLFEPLTCTKGAEVRCQVNYADHEGKMHSIWMEPKEISMTCSIMKTAHGINIGRLKEFIEDLPKNDSLIYEIKNGFYLKKLSILAREVVEKHDIRHNTHQNTVRYPDDNTVIEKASLLMRAGNYLSAISLLKKSLDCNPENKRFESLFNRAKKQWGQILIRENH